LCSLAGSQKTSEATLYNLGFSSWYKGSYLFIQAHVAHPAIPSQTIPMIFFQPNFVAFSRKKIGNFVKCKFDYFSTFGECFFFSPKKFQYHKIEKEKRKKKTPGPNIGTAPKLCHKALKKEWIFLG
jgi:hypothetical protein